MYNEGFLVSFLHWVMHMLTKDLSYGCTCPCKKHTREIKTQTRRRKTYRKNIQSIIPLTFSSKLSVTVGETLLCVPFPIDVNIEENHGKGLCKISCNRKQHYTKIVLQRSKMCLEVNTGICPAQNLY